MNVTYSDKRRKRILELVIEAYVSTALPVGSQLLAHKLRSGLSSATIRNIMADLEEAGYLEQPHTSAGRVPTDRGYRYYVDAVMDLQHISAEALREFEGRLEPMEYDVDRLLERAGALLVEFAQQAAFVVAPSVKKSTVKQVEFVPLSLRKLLCVMVANEEMVASHIVEIEEPMSRDEAAALSRFVNTELAGLEFASLLISLERRMLSQTDSFYHIVKRALQILQDALSTEPNERFLLQGTRVIIEQPEFSRDPKKAHDLLKGLDAEETLVERMRQDLAADSVQVRIGKEVKIPELESCSYVIAPFSFGHDHEMVGGIGVIGPKRMDYLRLRALVEGMGRCLSHCLNLWEQA